MCSYAEFTVIHSQKLNMLNAKCESKYRRIGIYATAGEPQKSCIYPSGVFSRIRIYATRLYSRIGIYATAREPQKSSIYPSVAYNCRVFSAKVTLGAKKSCI